MADPALKNSSSFNRTHSTEEKDHGHKKVIQSKSVVNISSKTSLTKPALPPRPIELSEKPAATRKKAVTLPKIPNQNKETEKHCHEDSSPPKPRRPPPPSHQSSVQTFRDDDELETNSRLDETKTTQKIPSNEKPQKHIDSTTKDRNVHDDQWGLHPSVSNNPQVLEYEGMKAASQQRETSSVKHVTSTDVEMSENAGVRDIAEQNAPVNTKTNTEKPPRPEKSTTSSINRTYTKIPHLPPPLSPTISRRTSLENPEKHKPISTSEKPKPPQVPRTPKVPAPVPRFLLKKSRPPEVARASHEEAPEMPVLPKLASTTQERSGEADTSVESKKDKPPRPRAPSRKTENTDERGPAISDNQIQPRQSFDVGAHVKHQVPVANENSKTASTVSPKPTRPSQQKGQDLSKTNKDGEGNVPEDAKEDDTKSLRNKNVEIPQKPPKPKLPSVVSSGSEHSGYNNGMEEGTSFESTSVSNLELNKTAVPTKPRRPSRPKHPEISTAGATEVNYTWNEKGIRKNKLQPSQITPKMTTVYREGNQTMKTGAELTSESNSTPLKKTVPIKPSRPPKPRNDGTTQAVSPAKTANIAKHLQNRGSE